MYKQNNNRTSSIRRPSYRSGSSYQGQGNGSSQGGQSSYGSTAPSPYKHYSSRDVVNSKPNFRRHSQYGFQKPQYNGGGGNSNGNSYGGRPRFNGQQQRSGGYQIKNISTSNLGLFIKKATSIEEASYTAQNTFNDFTICDELKQNISNRGYITPTPIQDQAIQPILQGSDLIGLANTGTGKTAAFLIPIINKIFQNKNEKALILAPTRELAVQIRDELYNFTQGMQIYSTLVIGGANMRRQIMDLKRQPHVVIGTPGRIKDLIGQRALYLSDYSTFVLDEVDMMVDIGFIQDVKYFISLLPSERQSLFFSATISPKVREILDQFVKNPVTVSIKQASGSENIDQDIIKINGGKKVELLHDLLIKETFEKVLIFGRTKRGIEKLYDELSTRGFKVGTIHGNKTQGQRQRTLDNFKQDQITILLATDVASRGLDIPNVSHVINYELPENYEDYIHRIGRTGRAGKTGSALTFID